MKLGEFFIDLVVNAGSGELTVKNLVTSMGELEAVTVGQIGLLYQMGVRLADITDGSIKTALGLEKFTSTTDESSTKLQQWQAAARMAGVSADTTASMFDNLSTGLENMRWGKATGILSGAVNVLKIDPRGKDVPALLEAIGTKLRAIKSHAERRHIADMIGIPPEALRLVLQTEAERAKAAEGAYIMSEKQQRKFLEIEHSMIKLQNAASMLAHSIAEWSAGDLLAGLKRAVELIKEIQRQIKTGEGPAGEAKDILKWSSQGWGAIFDFKKNSRAGDASAFATGIVESIMQPFRKKGPSSIEEATGENAFYPASLSEKLSDRGATPVRGPVTVNASLSFPNATKADEISRGVASGVDRLIDNAEYPMDGVVDR